MKTTFSRRELYAFGEPIGDGATVKKIGGGRIYGLGGGGGGGGPTQTTVQNTNVPEYAKPYVETMLGATQNQLFNTTQMPAEGDNPAYTRIDSFKPYQAYGSGTVGANSKYLNEINPKTGQNYKIGEGYYNPREAIAGFTPAQIAAQQGITGQYDPKTGKLALGPDGKPINAGLQLPSEFDDASAGIKGFIDAKNAYTAPKTLGYTSSDATTRDATSSGYTSTDAAAIKAEAAKLGLAPESLAAKSSYAPTLEKYQMGGPEKVATRSFTDKGTAESYMSPYRANVLDLQNKELERQAGIASNVRGAQAAKAGAFGGSRQGIENAEAQRNLAMMKNMNTAQGLQESYAQAMQQFNAEQGYGLQGQIANQQAGLTVGQQNLGANLGVQQLGTQTGTQMALANLSNEQQTALANQALKGQYGLTQGQFDQGANMQTSGQAQQAALANAAARSAASQFGAAAGNQASLANAAASNQASLANAAAKNAAAQFTAGQNLTSAQTAAQYGLAADQLGLQASTQLGALGGQELAARQGILGLQNQVGAQQQGLEQQVINQAIQDYSNTQQYPLMQLGTMSNMLRGLPMQASSTQQYQAQPSPLSQAVGTLGAGASIYNALKAEGGVIKGYAKGGIMSYDMGGEVESQLESMDEKGLAEQARESSSPSIRKMAQRILRERQMSRPSQGVGPMGVQYQAPQPPMPTMRGGGIIAFQQGGGAKPYYGPSTEVGGEEDARIDMEKRLAMEPTSGQMLQQRVMQGKPTGDVTDQPRGIVQAAPVSKPNLAMQEAAGMPAFMKAQYEEADKRMNAPLSDFMAERRAAMQEAGVADISEGQQRQRAEMMAEKANLGEEKERQKYLRMAEFFAKWGSTPGPTLVAGMNALRESVPGIIADEKEQKKARREIDKSIADLDNATRLEKRGEVDAALGLKLKAAEDMKALQTKFIEYQSQRERDASSAASSKYTADMHFKSEQLRSETSRLDRLANRETAADNKAFGQYQTAANQEQRVIAKIIDQAKLLEKDYATIKTAEMNRDANEGKMNPALVSGYEAAKKKIADQEAVWDKQKEAAARDTELAYSRIRLKPEADTTPAGNKANPKAPPTNRVPLNDPSLQKQ
jgi:hypothetical protein